MGKHTTQRYGWHVDVTRNGSYWPKPLEKLEEHLNMRFIPKYSTITCGNCFIGITCGNCFIGVTCGNCAIYACMIKRWWRFRWKKAPMMTIYTYVFWLKVYPGHLDSFQTCCLAEAKLKTIPSHAAQKQGQTEGSWCWHSFVNSTGLCCCRAPSAWLGKFAWRGRHYMCMYVYMYVSMYACMHVCMFQAKV